jgi:hypothetical protein
LVIDEQVLLIVEVASWTLLTTKTVLELFRRLIAFFKGDQPSPGSAIRPLPISGEVAHRFSQDWEKPEAQRTDEG